MKNERLTRNTVILIKNGDLEQESEDQQNLSFTDQKSSFLIILPTIYGKYGKQLISKTNVSQGQYQLISENVHQKN